MTSISPVHELKPKVITPMPRSNDLGLLFWTEPKIGPNPLLLGQPNKASPPRPRQHNMLATCSSPHGHVVIRAYSFSPIRGTAHPRMRTK
ncbi:hypothetical protein A2U01_0073621 [Trifolium medium]|uniref:Uncharacterized protein n=1 Tax=Trifolium medium TaxID=97028 RepID=A0A392SVB4_9FABA|nr:hypothetical protein [Trifolium medium]